jgi:HNH endonuclease
MKKRKLLDRSYIVDPKTGCWNWNGARTGSGYGAVSFKSSKGQAGVLAHRAAYQLLVGSVGDLHVCHRCDNKLCINPEHLFLGSQSENIVDMFTKGRGVDNRGERHGMRKLTDEKVREIRRLDALGEINQGRKAYLVRRFGASYMTIYNAAKGNTWKHL